MPHMKRGGSIINSSSVTAFKGSPQMLDYSSTKGAIITFTRSLAVQLAPKGIRVNAVCPGKSRANTTTFRLIDEDRPRIYPAPACLETSGEYGGLVGRCVTAAWTGEYAGGDGTGLCVPRLCGFERHDRSAHAPQ